MLVKSSPIVFENEYLRIEVDTVNLVINVEWFAATEDMTDEEYKSALGKIADYIKEYGIRAWIGNTLNLKLIVSVELQEWQGAIISSFADAGLEKLAVIAPEEFVSNLSVEQAVDEILNVNGNKLAIQYFNTFEKANEWVK